MISYVTLRKIAANRGEQLIDVSNVPERLQDAVAYICDAASGYNHLCQLHQAPPTFPAEGGIPFRRWYATALGITSDEVRELCTLSPIYRAFVRYYTDCTETPLTARRSHTILSKKFDKHILFLSDIYHYGLRTSDALYEDFAIASMSSQSVPVFVSKFFGIDEVDAQLLLKEDNVLYALARNAMGRF